MTNTLHSPKEFYITTHPMEAKSVGDSFGGRLYMTSEETAGILKVDVKTLRKLCKAGKIGFVVVGMGFRRPRRRFTREHVVSFLAGRDDAPRVATSVGSRRDEVRAAARVR